MNDGEINPKYEVVPEADTFGIFGREEELSIALDKIETFGKDAILVKTDSIGKIHNESESFLKKFLKKFFIK